MRNLAFLIKESGMSHYELIQLPYSVFLSYLKQFRIFQLEQTEEGRKALYQSSILQQKEPQWNKIRNQDGYKQVKSKREVIE